MCLKVPRVVTMLNHPAKKTNKEKEEDANNNNIKFNTGEFVSLKKLLPERKITKES